MQSFESVGRPHYSFGIMCSGVSLSGAVDMSFLVPQAGWVWTRPTTSCSQVHRGLGLLRGLGA